MVLSLILAKLLFLLRKCLNRLQTCKVPSKDRDLSPEIPPVHRPQDNFTTYFQKILTDFFKNLSILFYGIAQQKKKIYIYIYSQGPSQDADFHVLREGGYFERQQIYYVIFLKLLLTALLNAFDLIEKSIELIWSFTQSTELFTG